VAASAATNLVRVRFPAQSAGLDWRARLRARTVALSFFAQTGRCDDRFSAAIGRARRRA